MTENEQKQQLSIAYVHAVAARAGFGCQATLVDDDSVDVVISAVGQVHERAIVLSPRIELQLKATSQDLLGEDHLVFPLPVKNDNDLRGKTSVPRLLVVLLLPSDPERWLEQGEEQMIVRRCAYWLSLFGEPASDNVKSVTIRIPRGNCLTVDSLRNLMQRASRRLRL